MCVFVCVCACVCVCVHENALTIISVASNYRVILHIAMYLLRVIKW